MLLELPAPAGAGPLLQRSIPHIERLFRVRVSCGAADSRTGTGTGTGTHTVVVIIQDGTEQDCSRAKDYIVSLIAPLRGPHEPGLMEDGEGEGEGSGSESEGERRGRGEARSELTAKPHRQLCRSPCLDRPSFSQSSTLQEAPPPPPPPVTPPLPPAGRDYRTKVEFALKLGYSGEQVEAVLSKLGPGALTNDVLAELVRLGSRAEEAGGAQAPPPSPVPPGAPGEVASPEASLEDEGTDAGDNLRPVVIDGSNVAMSHGNKEVFSCLGIRLATDWFLERGHRDVTVFVPAWRKEQSRPDAPITDQEILRRLEKEKILVFTPSRRVQGRRVVCYDDRFIVKLACDSDGVIVSNDNYRDLQNERPEWKRFIEERLLMYSFVNDKFMPPDDPLGRHGPSLENFLRKRPVVPEHKKQPCPYGKKCTYGHKCKYYHPERASQPARSVADELRAFARLSAGKTLSDGALARGGGGGRGDAPEARRAAAPKRQSDPSIPCPSLVTALSVPTLPPPKSHAAGALNARSASSPVPGSLHFGSVQYPPILVTDSQGAPVAYGGAFAEYDPAAGERGYYAALSDLSVTHLELSDRPADPYPPYPMAAVGGGGGEEGMEAFAGYRHEAPGRARSYGAGDEPPPARLALHPVVGGRSSCPGDYPPPPTATVQPSRSLGMTRMDSVSDSRLYQGDPLRQRRPPLCREQHASWDPLPHGRTGYGLAPCCGRVMVRSMPEKMEQIWWSPWDAPRGRRPLPEHQCQTYRNLCNIFPPHVVHAVMENNPCLTDPQQLAAVIVTELRAGH